MPSLPREAKAITPATSAEKMQLARLRRIATCGLTTTGSMPASCMQISPFMTSWNSCCSSSRRLRVRNVCGAAGALGLGARASDPSTVRPGCRSHPGRVVVDGRIRTNPVETRPPSAGPPPSASKAGRFALGPGIPRVPASSSRDCRRTARDGRLESEHASDLVEADHVIPAIDPAVSDVEDLSPRQAPGRLSASTIAFARSRTWINGRHCRRPSA